MQQHLGDESADNGASGMPVWYRRWGWCWYRRRGCCCCWRWIVVRIMARWWRKETAKNKTKFFFATRMTMIQNWYSHKPEKRKFHIWRVGRPPNKEKKMCENICLLTKQKKKLYLAGGYYTNKLFTVLFKVEGEILAVVFALSWWLLKTNGLWVLLPFWPTSSKAVQLVWFCWGGSCDDPGMVQQL